MTKRPKPQRKPVRPKQRRLRKKRLVLREDPNDGHDRLLKIDRTLKNNFAAAYKGGQVALTRHDLPALKDAIEREGEAIGEHIRLIKRPNSH